MFVVIAIPSLIVRGIAQYAESCRFKRLEQPFNALSNAIATSNILRQPAADSDAQQKAWQAVETAHKMYLQTSDEPNPLPFWLRISTGIMTFVAFWSMVILALRALEKKANKEIYKPIGNQQTWIARLNAHLQGRLCLLSAAG
jgi:hypothetical protein